MAEEGSSRQGSRRSSDQSKDAERLYKQVSELIREAILNEWLQRVADPKVHVTPSDDTGGTDAIILRAHVEIELFVKYHLTDHKREQQGYELLQNSGPEEFTHHLVPPAFQNPQPFWLTPHAQATPLHQLVCASPDSRVLPKWLMQVYDQVLSRMQDLWVHTRMPVQAPNLAHIYITRINNRLPLIEEGVGIRDLHDLRINVNGRDFGMFRDVMADFTRRVERARAGVHFTCTAQCDEHAKNIMVFERRAPDDQDAWLLIDYANARADADWIFSIAKMLYWWRPYSALERAKTEDSIQKSLQSSIGIEDGCLMIRYDEAVLGKLIPAGSRPMHDTVMQFAAKVAQDFEEDAPSWKRRLKLATFSVMFGAAALHFRDWPFAVPIMIGESLKTLAS